MTVILTHNGRYLDLANPEGYDFPIEEIALGLARTSRFAGQTILGQYNWSAGYTVAQHSVRCSYLVPPELALQALMHDAHEAYIGDATSPWKQAVGPAYRKAEARVAAALLSAHGLPEELAPEVKAADLEALRTERRLYMPRAVESHPLGFPPEWEPKFQEWVPHLNRAWGPYNACNWFLLRYYNLVLQQESHDVRSV